MDFDGHDTYYLDDCAAFGLSSSDTGDLGRDSAESDSFDDTDAETFYERTMPSLFPHAHHPRTHEARRARAHRRAAQTTYLGALHAWTHIHNEVHGGTGTATRARDPFDLTGHRREARVKRVPPVRAAARRAAAPRR